MAYDKSLFSSCTSGHPFAVELGSGNTAEVRGKGTVEIYVALHGKRVKCVPEKVFNVPDLGYQLLSIPTFDKSGLDTYFTHFDVGLRKTLDPLQLV